MDCILPAVHVKTLLSSLQMLGRIGTDIYIEFHPFHGLTFKTLNETKSAYCCFHWKPDAFVKCSENVASKRKTRQGSSSQEDDEDEEPTFQGRIAVKSLEQVLKSRREIQQLGLKDVDAANQTFLSFEFWLGSGPDTTLHLVHRLAVCAGDTAIGDVLVDRNVCSWFKAEPRLIKQMLDPLPSNQEVSLILNPTHQVVSLVVFDPSSSSSSRNTPAAAAHHQNALLVDATHRRTLQTQTTIHADDLLELTLQEQPDAVELDEELVLVFHAQAVQHFLPIVVVGDLSVYFQYGGKPLVWNTHQPGVVTGELIVATLPFQDLDPSKWAAAVPQQQQQQQQANHQDGEARQ